MTDQVETLIGTLRVGDSLVDLRKRNAGRVVEIVDFDPKSTRERPAMSIREVEPPYTKQRASNRVTWLRLGPDLKDLFEKDESGWE